LGDIFVDLEREYQFLGEGESEDLFPFLQDPNIGFYPEQADS
jgi:hypothetical protein